MPRLQRDDAREPADSGMHDRAHTPHGNSPECSENEQRVCLLYTQRLLSIGTIARRVKMDEPAVRELLGRNGIPLRRRYTSRQTLLAKSDELRLAYERGATIRTLAELHDRPFSSIRWVLLQAGVTLRRRGGRPQ